MKCYWNSIGKLYCGAGHKQCRSAACDYGRWNLRRTELDKLQDERWRWHAGLYTRYASEAEDTP